jgi:hypothetical protein
MILCLRKRNTSRLTCSHLSSTISIYFWLRKATKLAMMNPDAQEQREDMVEA